jgi:Fur family ferric uptake transcriptional regulator
VAYLSQFIALNLTFERRYNNENGFHYHYCTFMTNQILPSKYETWLDSLQEGGYRLTAPRKAIVAIIANSSRALDALEIYDLGRVEHPRLGLVTVYRTLEKLDELGLVQRVHQPDGCNMYLRAPEGHEHLLVCKSCRHMEYFSGDDLSELIERISQRSGYQVQEHWLQLFGLCGSCQAVASRQDD